MLDSVIRRRLDRHKSLLFEAFVVMLHNVADVRMTLYAMRKRKKGRDTTKREYDKVKQGT